MKRILLLVVWIAMPSAPLRAEAEEKAPEPGKPGSLRVENERGQVTTLTLEDFAKLPRQKIKATGHSGKPATYEGVSLAEVLRAAKVALGENLKGLLLANCLVIEASDGYRVVFSLAEVDPAMTDQVVLLADRKDGERLDAKEGPYRLVVPHDKRAMRWVRQVTRIAVQRAAAVADGSDLKAERALAELKRLGGKVVLNGKAPGNPVVKLGLSGTATTDADLVHVGAFPLLEELSLAGTKITDAGLAHLSKMTGLEVLDLSGSAITDLGLEHLKPLTGLRSLNLRDTKVTEKGMAVLGKVLPKAKIVR